MNPDLRDLLAAWLGADVEAGRRAELLARLRADEAFRHAFVEEIHMLGMLRAVQSTEPRWLLLGDELGWSAEEHPTRDQLEERILQRIQELPPRRRISRWWGLAAAALVLACLLALWPSRRNPAPVSSAPSWVAAVVKAEGVQWDAQEGTPPNEGSTLPPGHLRLRAGRLTLAFLNNVMLSLEGPADLELLSVERVFCHWGKLHTRVPSGIQGFTVLAPGSAVVDLGTEFGLNVSSDGTAELMVFEGKTEVSVLNADGYTVRSELLGTKKAVEVDPKAGRIQDRPAAPDRFIGAPDVTSPPLRLSPAYAEEVRKSRPWGYWRFETLADGLVPNEMPGAPALRAAGSLELAGEPGQNHSVVLRPDQRDQYLVLNGSWTPPRDSGYAVEVWALSEGFKESALVSLNAQSDPVDKQVFFLQLQARSQELLHWPCAVRFVDRWPPDLGGGVNLFTRRMYIPYHWHYLVAQRTRDRLELYLDGRLMGTAQPDPHEATTPCRMLVGRLKEVGLSPTPQYRPFVGRLDELAVYDHPLSAREIEKHYELRVPGETSRADEKNH